MGQSKTRFPGLVAILFLSMTWPAGGQRALPLGEQIEVEATACDTREQAEDILAVHSEHGFAAANWRYLQWQNVENEEGEPTCGRISATVEVLERVARHAGLEFPNGKKDVFVLRIRLEGREFYALSLLDAGRES